MWEFILIEGYRRVVLDRVIDRRGNKVIDRRGNKVSYK